MKKKQIESMLNYVTIALEQANAYKKVHNLVCEHGLNLAKQPSSNEEINALEIAHCDLELQLKNYKENVNDCVNCKQQKAVICDSCVSSIASIVSNSVF